MQITSAVVWPNGKTYFFACGNQYIRYDIARDLADQLPKPVSGNWPGLAEAFPSGIDAAVVWPSGKAYFFKGNQYVAYNADTAHEGVLEGYPRAINAVDTHGKEFWPGLKAAGFDSSLDAVVAWPHYNRAYFFKGNLYIAYNMDPAHEGVLPGYPKPINAVDSTGKEFWPGLKKAGFDSGLDAVIAWPNGKAYFFKGSEYLRYNMDLAHEGVEARLSISDNWQGLECALANPPLWMQLTHIRCLAETNDGSASDEIYVVMYSADVTGLLPAGVATMTPLFEDFDAGETRVLSTANWGLNGSATPISDPSKVILLAGMMENDQSEPGAVQTAVGSAMIAQLASYKASNLPRPALVANLQNDMFAAEGLGALSGKLDTDERVGTCLEIPLSEADVIAARLGRVVTKELDFAGDGGHYQVRWQLGKAGTIPNLSPQW